MFGAELITYISLVFWLLPPFRQYKGRFFYYFLIMALSDPITLLCYEIIKIPINSIHSIAGLLLIVTVIFNVDRYKNKVILLLLLTLGFILGWIYLPDLLYLLIIIHIIIFLILLKIAILPIYQKNIVNIFYFALLFYELSIVLNLTLFTSTGDVKIILFYMTLAFQIVIAIFFTIFTERNESIILHLKQIDTSQ